MQKKKQNKNNTIKEIILYILLVVIILLITFSEDIIKLANKNKINLAENSEIELIINEPNPPQLSAGMIPVKWNGTNWIITTKNDKDWYDYKDGKPAYIMLNDGYYQSELIRNMTNKALADENVGNDALVVPDVPDNNPTILIWIPRFAYKETGEIGYIKEETTPGGEWTVPEMFSYAVADETKPDFSLNGVWVEKDVDTEFASKITQMNQEESVYGFIANTKARQINSNDTNAIQNYINTLTANIIGVDASANPQTDTTNTVVNDALVVPSITDITNPNRIILQIVNTNKFEPIKAKITHNTQKQKLEIRVTYTTNGIREILDEYGNKMVLKQENGVIYTDTGDTVLISGTYKFAIIDNKGNKKEISIYLNVSLFKVAYINGIDNMNNTATYIKTQETKTTDETELLSEISTIDTSTTYSRAIKDSNEAITSIGEEERGSDEETVYIYSKYNVNSTTTYSWVSSGIQKDAISISNGYGYPRIITNSQTGVVKTDGSLGSYMNNGGRYNVSGVNYYVYSTGSKNKLNKTTYVRQSTRRYSQGGFLSYVLAQDNTFTIGSSTKVHSDGYWYIRNNLAPKYTLYKYSSDLNLQSTYDVDTGVLTTSPINISNKGNNKLKLTLNTTGTDYKTYISNDNTNWQEITDITSGTPKELNVDGWDNLYIKIETNTSIINNIDIAYYKD